MEPEKLDFEVAHDSVLFEVCIVVSCLCFMSVCAIEFWRVDGVFVYMELITKLQNFRNLLNFRMKYHSNSVKYSSFREVPDN